MGRYDRNLIISLLPGLSTQLLEEKCKKDNTPTDVIFIQFDGWGDVLPLSDTEKLKINRLTGASRLYIHAHGEKGFGGLGDRDKHILYYQQLVCMLANHINKNNITGLRIRLFSCYSSSGTTASAQNSLAEKMLAAFKQLDIENVSLIGNADPVTIIQNPYTRKIYTYTQTDLEKNIREKAISNRAKVLENAKTAFLDQISDYHFFDKDTLEFIKDNLSSEALLDINNVGRFISHLCEYELQKSFLKTSNVPFLMHLIGLMSLTKEILISVSLQYQSTAFDETMNKLKQANYARSNVKTLFIWNGEKETKMDCFQNKQAILT